MESSHQVGFDILDFKILFMTICNMNMYFYFVTIVFKNHKFKIGISKIYWNTNKGHNLQIGLQMDEMLNFSKFQVNGVLKCSCKLPFFPIIVKMHQTFNADVWKNTIFTNQFQAYLLLLFHQSFSNFIQLTINSIEAYKCFHNDILKWFESTFLCLCSN
jgi:hypothetical protein